jgi:hypothetical protein
MDMILLRVKWKLPKSTWVKKMLESSQKQFVIPVALLHLLLLMSRILVEKVAAEEAQNPIPNP